MDMPTDTHVKMEDTHVRKVSPKCPIHKKNMDTPLGVSDTDTATNLKCPCFIARK